MSTTKDVIQRAWALSTKGQYREALEQLESIRAHVMLHGEASERATLLQSMAANTDRLGDYEGALKLVNEALDIDRAQWPHGRGAFLSLRSLHTILKHLGRDADARQAAREMIAVADKLSGVDLVDAVLLADTYLDEQEANDLLNRARFQAKVFLHEGNPSDKARYELILDLGAICFRLSARLSREGKLDPAAEPLHDVSNKFAPWLKHSNAQGMLGECWIRLAAISRKKGNREEARLFLRYAALVASHRDAPPRLRGLVIQEFEKVGGGKEQPGDFDPVLKYRVCSQHEPLVLAHPLNGCLYPMKSRPEDVGDLQLGDLVELSSDANGQLRVQRSSNSNG